MVKIFWCQKNIGKEAIYFNKILLLLKLYKNLHGFWNKVNLYILVTW